MHNVLRVQVLHSEDLRKDACYDSSNTSMKWEVEANNAAKVLVHKLERQAHLLDALDKVAARGILLDEHDAGIGALVAARGGQNGGRRTAKSSEFAFWVR